MNINLRNAILEDIPILQHWDKQQHVIDCDPEDDWDWSEMLVEEKEWQKMLVAELNGRAIGFVQIIDPYLEETNYWGEIEQNLRAIDIWIGEATDLGKGYGTVMMNLAIEKCFSNEKVKAIVIDPLETNVLAIKFYKKLGFKFVAKREFTKGYMSEVLRLERKECRQK